MSDAARSYVQHLLTEQETRRREAMASLDVEHLGQTLCAFLNGTGGTVLIGVKDQGDVIGVKEPAAVMEAARTELAAHLQPAAPWSFNEVKSDGLTIILVEVPSGPRSPYLWKNVIYTRRGTATHPAQPQEITAILKDRHSTGDRWERLPVLGADFSDLDERVIAETIDKACSLGRTLPSKPRAALEELGLLTPGSVCNSALVLFGRNPSRWYPQTRVRMGAFEGGRFLDEKLAEGHLFAIVDAAISFLRRNIRIEAELPAGSFARESRPRFPFLAVREGLMNALVHRDYAAYDGDVSIAIFEDRLEIQNPGSFPPGIKPDEKYGGYVSKPINPDIAHILMIHGLVEHWGIGIRRIIDECERAGAQRPTWVTAQGRVLLTIYAASGRQSAAPALNERQLELLRDLAPGESVDARGYHERYARDASDRQVRHDLTQLVQLGYLIRTGRSNRAMYARASKPVRR
jgi:ATP-dependent DNA helicase RecG